MPSEIFEVLITLLPEGSYLVGGALRDCLIGRPSLDIDIALPLYGSAIRIKSSAIAKALSAVSFPLDEKNNIYRIVIREKDAGTQKQIDLSAFQGADINQDLLRRDFSVNAMGYPLRTGSKFKTLNSKLKILNLKNGMRITGINAKLIVDPCAGKRDIQLKTVRLAGENAFQEDPLRMLRAFRIAAELGWTIHPETLKQISKDKKLLKTSAPERMHYELMRLLEMPKSSFWLEEMDKAGLLAEIFPEIERQRLCAQVYYGKGGVLKHSILVVKRMEYLLSSIKKIFPHIYRKISAYENEKSILKLAALLHDIAKPARAKIIGKRLRFFGHEEYGAKMAEKTMEKLRFSRAHINLVSKLIRHHLRPGNLSANQYISDKAVYRFFRDTGQEGIALLLLCWADHTSYLSDSQLASVEKKACEEPLPVPEGGFPDTGTEKTLRYIQVINKMLTMYFKEKPKIIPEKLINGNDVMSILGIPESPVIGKILERVRSAQAGGKITGRREALQFIKSSRRPT